MKPARSKPAILAKKNSYPVLLRNVTALLDEGRRASARTVNVIMTATYWQVGRHIVEFEQAGERRAQRWAWAALLIGACGFMPTAGG